ncbi:Benzaldehyde dehydrogenase [NAD(+)] [compost metagenome]
MTQQYLNRGTGLLSDEMAGSVYIRGFRPATGGSTIVTDKASGVALYEGGIASLDDVADACRSARLAQHDWARRSPVERGDILRRFAQLCELHAEEIGRWIVRETGSVAPKAPFEILTSAREAIETAGYTGQPIGHILATATSRRSYARRVPLGVVGVITPWNSPFILAARVILPALAMGNAVVLKPDIQTPVCGGYLLARLFELAGVPEGVLAVLPGAGDVGAALTENPDVNMISFTGSTAAGRKVGEAAGRGLKKIALELGGNNALIAFHDADLEATVSAAAFGSFFHQGQICFSVGRHIVHETIAEAYASKLAEKARQLHVGDPCSEQVHLGPLINEKQAQRVQALLDDSLRAGARLLAGGSRTGQFFQPTVLVGVTTEMPIYTDEIFGPVAPILTFRTDEEAIALANGNEYGLATALFTCDQGKAMRIAESLHTGIVHINDQTVLHEVYGPIGGMGASGNGSRSGGPTVMDEYSQWQWVTVSDEVPTYPF